ncbi:hypothetical protein F3Y22_tig00110422pilonHSYRG00048 [Hibiscus syriacus]|uniref:Uncharacterized protein n=1 Tax=Hibiscus syriacus TaxID=106335 RepID=A0A6A3AQA4_HIBSY|nr:hypothetical protein F3Y22_tig00110422pilonHSYRG00048 [Hibiscus syriacus]
MVSLLCFAVVLFNGFLVSLLEEHNSWPSWFSVRFKEAYGNGLETLFWTENWLGQPLCDHPIILDHPVDNVTKVVVLVAITQRAWFIFSEIALSPGTSGTVANWEQGGAVHGPKSRIPGSKIPPMLPIILIHSLRTVPGASSSSRLVQWLSPSAGWVKLNTDGASQGNSGVAAHLGACLSVAVELFALHLGLLIAWKYDYNDVECEVDAQVVLRLIDEDDIVAEDGYRIEQNRN